MANRKIKAELEFQGKDSTTPAFRSVAARMGQIERQIGQFNKTAAAFNSKIGQVQQRVSAFTRAAKGVETAASGIRAGLGVFAAYGVAQGIKGAITDFAALERQMTRIGITSGATAEETRQAFEQLQQVAKDLNYDSVAPAVEAMDTLVASGMSVKEALAFIPSVLATAQAAGAATSDIANAGLKAASALKLEAGQLQRMFDLMVAGGKAGQFELKDMAQYIPGLANSFASLGYEGEEGVKQLIAVLQTLREDTGDATSAATQAQNIFGKIYSEETGNKFAKFGINLRKEMEAARASGESTLNAFMKLTKKALDGDMSKLPLLFSDQEFRLGMQSLLSSEESLRKFLDLLNSAEVDGTVFRDVRRVMQDTQADIDKLSNRWETLKTSMGQAIATNGGVQVMEGLSNGLDYATAVNKGLEKNGVHGFMARTRFGLTSDQFEKDRMAAAGGYNEPEWLKDYIQRLYESGQVKASTGRQGQRVIIPEFPGGGRGYTPRNLPSGDAPVPLGRPMAVQAADEVQRHSVQRGGGRTIAAAIAPFDANVFQDFETRITRSTEQGAKATAEGGERAGEAIKEGAAALSQVVADLRASIREIGSTSITVRHAASAGTTISGRVNGGVNADTGRSMPSSTFGPK